MDIFIEHLVKKKTTVLDVLIRIGLVLAAIVALSLVFAVPSDSVWSMVVVFVACGALFGGWYVFTGLSIEYEYAVTNGEIDIDKIIAQRKRSRLVTIKAQNIEKFGKYTPDVQIPGTIDTKLVACDTVKSPDVYYIVFRHNDRGRTMVVMNMPERVFAGIKNYLPRELRNEINYGN